MIFVSLVFGLYFLLHDFRVLLFDGFVLVTIHRDYNVDDKKKVVWLLALRKRSERTYK